VLVVLVVVLVVVVVLTILDILAEDLVAVLASTTDRLLTTTLSGFVVVTPRPRDSSKA
jgi:hypothetical protein